jgi:copper(I)-binding protein
MKTTAKRALTGAFVLTALLGMSSCASSDESAVTTPSIKVTGQWARTSPAATTMGAAYMTLSADTDDELVGASVDKSVAMMTEIHEIVMVDGAMKMQQVSSIPVTAGTATELKPGGYHVMFMQLTEPLQTGDTIQVTLTFAKAGDIVVDVPIMEDAP